MLPAFGQIKCIKNGICLLNVVAPSKQRETVSQATRVLDEGSHECSSVSATNLTTVGTPPQTSSESLCLFNYCLGKHQPSAEYHVSSKAPQMPCPVFSPDVMAKRPGLGFQFISQDHCMCGCATSSFESKLIVPLPPQLS